jgi:beta-aspartyl-peptidase (threonine type)
VTAPALAVHGGAWDIPPAERAAHAAGCRAALEAGAAALAAGGAALEAVVAATVSMEASGIFDAGRGSVLNAEGAVENDAGLMDGDSLRVGAVAAMPRTAHPIRVARLLLDEPELAFMVGDGAVRWAADRGILPCAAADLVHPREAARYAELRRVRATVRSAFAGRDDAADPRPAAPRGTVGAVARDAAGRLAAACSTGGTPFKPPGRVGDTPVVGSGFFADALFGAAACTGFGETILRVQLARLACERIVPAGSADAAALEALGALRARAAGLGGLVVLGPHGRPAARWNTPTMAYGFWTPEGVHSDCP